MKRLSGPLLFTVLGVAAGLAATSARAVVIQVVNADSPGEGFNDPTPRAPVAGNAGTTLGQQRQIAFLAAAAYWANRLASPVPIVVQASMDALPCSPTGGTLGSAGFFNAFLNFPGAPQANTWYVSALADAKHGSDVAPNAPDVVAQFNSGVDDDPNCIAGLDWFYGVGVAAPAGREPFYETVRHEIAHGLGFLTLVDPETGERFQGFNDSFMVNLEDHSTGKKWPQMSNNERAASAVDSGDLHWTGPAAVAAGSSLSAGRHPGGHLRMYSPNPFEEGSSVAHWDTLLSPDEMMEPNATPTVSDIVTTALLQDIGWSRQQAAGPCVRDATTACLNGGRIEVKVTFDGGTAGSGAAKVMAFTGQRAENDESAFFWFFSPTNFEMAVKVLNACSLNGRFWVFASGLTNQGWVVTVRDTVTGATKSYTNSRGTLSRTVADTDALGC